MDGILIVDKPAGMTSHDVVDFIRRRFGIKKVGHAGTLDPMATGLLVMLLGRFTKESSRLSSRDKEYSGRMTLGARSDTGDRDGKITQDAQALSFSRADIEKVFDEFTGEVPQIPPMYSAVKIKGKKMYELARRGIEVERTPKKVVITSLKLKAFNLPFVDFEVACSKGTYVRQLASDIGERLGCGAYLESLRRTASGGSTIQDAIPFERLKCISREELAKTLIEL